MRGRAFQVLWIATVIGNIGTWVRDTASAWFMTELSSSAFSVALVQAAAVLPAFLLSIPAGALADIVDRRRLMIVVQVSLALISVVLAVLTQMGLMTAFWLLLLSALVGVGGALTAPAWQAIVPELAHKSQLKSAVALNSAGVNVARAIGPPLAGVLIVTAGVGSAYWIDVMTYAVVIGALVWWNRATPPATHREQLFGAVRAGVRYAVRSAPLRRVLIRAVLFLAPASCYVALLPLIARDHISGGASAYGLLLGAIGAGAIIGAIVLPRLHRSLSTESLTLLSALITAACMCLFMYVRAVIGACALLFFAGATWIAMLTSFSAAVQGVLPDWVRARGLAVYLTVFAATMTAGSMLWGYIADQSSVAHALAIAGGAGAALAFAARTLPLPRGDADVTASGHWGTPELVVQVAPASGPVKIEVEYRVPRDFQPAFLCAMRPLRTVRLRDGAYHWELFVDGSDPERIVETFVAPSWDEHLRQHDRVTVADRDVQQRVNAYHCGDSPPRVHHLFAPAASAHSHQNG